ncbi:MAG: S8 family serine peptidase, partial [Isosphaeraceae bacterium]|nr:S8 family serine peptidase [Isosphaeraceae bacterium]
MGSVKGNGRDRGPERRREARNPRHRTRPRMEILEGRTLLTGTAPPDWQKDLVDLTAVKSGPLAKAGQDLVSIYEEYQAFVQGGGGGQFTSQKAGIIRMQGNLVGIDARGRGDVGDYTTALQKLGMQVQAVDPVNRIVEGMLPIDQLPAAVALPNTVGIDPIYKPILRSQGSAADQGEQVLQANTARAQFGVDGTGITVGVLSDSADRAPNPGGRPPGLAGSIQAGDLPPLSRINVLQDEPVGGNNSDEGRAMMEDVYDIAPGANLAFATAVLGPVSMAQNIRALSRQAGAQVIVDDVGYANEPFFQDGVISQAVTDVVRNDNRVYLSAAGNDADHGFEEPFHGVNATVGQVGAGRFMNFNPNPTGPAVTQLPITVNSPGMLLFQYDNPFYTTNGVTSDLDVFVLDANGNIVAAGVTNNIASQSPEEIVDIPRAGNFTIAVQVAPGSPDVGRIALIGFGLDADFSKQFGNQGGITYPTTFGHSAGTDAIGVGAVPWFNAPPFGTQNPLQSEDFSSFGPVHHFFDPQGNRLATPVTLFKPDVSSPDGNNTSFFGTPAGQGVPPGLPANNYSQPNFFGTSDAAPNLAAVVALMRQLSPGSTPADIRNALITSATATPLNPNNPNVPKVGTPQGTWDPQGGYGLVQAVSALQAVDVLRVNSTSPAVGQIASMAPQYLFVSFTRPIDPSSLQASDLVINSAPPGVTVTVGQPVFNPQLSTSVVAFPLMFNRAPGAKANGTFTYTLPDGVIVSDAASGSKPLRAFQGSFSVLDTTAPKVTNTSFDGRTVTIQFSEPLQPSSINSNSVVLVRSGGTGQFNSPSVVYLTSNPLVKTVYDPTTNKVTIDLSALPQSALPSDNYALLVFDSVTDLVGNKLDGEFSGVFPSGNGQEGGVFIQHMDNVQLSAPTVSFFGLDQGVAGVRPTSDTGIPGDQDTRVTRPTFSGHLASAFPGSVAGVLVVAEFNGLHGGVLDLAPGAVDPADPLRRSRGFVGNFDVTAVTDAFGNFTFTAPADLPQGYNTVRLIVIGGADQPPLPGYSRQFDHTFRIDTTTPIVLGASLQKGVWGPVSA